MQTWHPQPELNLGVQVGKGLRAVIPGSATVSSVITERVMWAECEPFMNMHSRTWRSGTLAYVGRKREGRRGREGEGQVLT